MVETREVRSRAELRAFVAFPERLYGDHPCYVPKLLGDERRTLTRETNPAFEFCDARCWMAFRNGEPVGRIAGIINRRYIEIWGHKRARFGWLDFIDDHEVSAALLHEVEAWARSNGLEQVHGPLGFCDMDREGVLVDGFDELDLLITNYNFPYYPEHLQRLGYAKDVDWVEYLMRVPEVMPDKVDRLSRIVLGRSNLRLLRTVHRKDLLPYVKGVFDLLNETYKDLYAVVPLTDRQVAHYTKAFFGLIDHELVKIILDHDGQVAAVGIAMPSLSRGLQRCRGSLLPFGFFHLLRGMRTTDRLDLLLTGVRPDLQNKGINSVLINEVWRTASRRRMKWCETGPQLETNWRIQAQWKHFDRRQHRRRRCFVKTL